MRQIAFMTLLFLFFAHYAGAEFYRYTDENGKVRYTDDFGMIPEDQRPGVKEYQAYETNTTNVEATLSPGGQSEPESEKKSDSGAEKLTIDMHDRAADSGQTEDEEKNYDFDAVYKSLGEKRNSLALEYDEMMKEREELAKLSEGELTSDQIDARNAKVRAFNDRVKSYQEKKESFEKEMTEYNAKAIETMKKTLEDHETRESEKIVAE